MPGRQVGGWTVSRWETAAGLLSPEAAVALDQVFKTRGLFTYLQVLAAREAKREQHGAALPEAEQAEGTMPTIAVQVRKQEVDDVRRREFAGFLGAGATALAADRLLAALGPGVVDALEASRKVSMTALAPGTIDALFQAVARYSRELFSTDPAATYPEVRAMRGYVGDLMGGKLTLGQHRDLVVLAGWFSVLLACLVSDLGDRQTAAAWSADALGRGKEAGHGELVAWAQEVRALLAFYSDRPDEAVSAAKEGQEVAAPGSPVMVQLLGQELRAWARLGKRKEAAVALDRAETAAQALASTACSDELFGLNAVSLPYYATTAFLALGQPEQAERHARRVIAGLPPDRHPTMMALAHVDLGLIRAGLGQPDGAYEAGLVALSTQRPGRSIVVRAGELDAAFQRQYPGTAQARDFHERYLAARRSLESRKALEAPSGGPAASGAGV